MFWIDTIEPIDPTDTKFHASYFVLLVFNVVLLMFLFLSAIDQYTAVRTRQKKCRP